MYRNTTLICCFFLFSLGLFACSGSSSFDSGVGVSIIEPADDREFTAGARIDLVIVTENFLLGSPDDAPGAAEGHAHAERDFDVAALADHPDEPVTSPEHGHGASPEHEMDHSVEHDHLADPSSNEDHHAEDEVNAVSGGVRGNGHYHIYLDSARDGDPHITAWDHNYSYELPSDITPGTHTLRVELRNNDHTGTGIDDILFFKVQ